MDDFWKDVSRTDRDAIEALFKELREHQRADTLFALTKGAEIAIWKPKIIHGDLLETLNKEAGLLPRTSQRWMKAAKAFEGRFDDAALLHRQAVYDLSADSAWIPGVRDAVLARLKANNIPTLAEVRTLCEAARHKSASSKTEANSLKAHNEQREIENGADTLFRLLKTRKAEVVKIISSTHWSQIRKRLLDLFDSA